ncbi:hypothetical protein KFL_001280220 [Klebsormidium nitens]|uniref:Uncharacterized protein n=1 Tax=Klebsormidium nitens TaxID=105231 RepID=A0A1Y1HYT7_KLENI|nr:hypothetical protein KFL_001280220 [Klebsormidium nitens]|eukprot:GAQ82902.1 hypothetical protein KFL_001280220 [Klebsormidium nitens]
MDIPWVRQRSLQLSPTKCFRSSTLLGRETVCGKLRRLSGAKKPGVKGEGRKCLSKDLGVSTSLFMGERTKFLASPPQKSCSGRCAFGTVNAAYGTPLGAPQRRRVSVVTRARTQPMPQGTYVQNSRFRKPNRVPSNSEYLDDEGWGTEGGPEDFLAGESEAEVASDVDSQAETSGRADDDNGGPLRKLHRELSLDSLADEGEDREGDYQSDLGSSPERPRRTYTELQPNGQAAPSASQAHSVVLPQRPRRVYREITPHGQFKDEAEAEHRQKMAAAGKVPGVAFGIKTPVTDGPIARQLGLVKEEVGALDAEGVEEEDEEYQGKRVVVERVPGARRKAAEEEALPPKAQTKEEFDRLYEEYLQREEEKRIEAKRQKAIFEVERKERVRLIEEERVKRKAELASMGIVENKQFEIPSETIERIQRLKGKEKREAWVAAWRRVRKQETREKNKVRQSKAALQKEAEEYLHLAMQKLIGGDITRVRGRTAMDIIANTMAGRLGDGLPEQQKNLLEEIPPMPVNYKTVEEKAQRIFTSTYIEQFRPEANDGQGIKTVVSPFREADPTLAQEKGLPSLNLESAPPATEAGLFGRGVDLEVESEVEARISADLARLEREAQMELQGGAGSSEFEGGVAELNRGLVSGRGDSQVGNSEAQAAADVGGESVSYEGTANGARGSEPRKRYTHDDDDDPDERKDGARKASSAGADDSDPDSDDDDIKKIGEELFPDFDEEELTSASHRGASAESDGRDPDDMQTIGEDLFPDYEPEINPNVDLSEMGRLLGRRIADVAGYQQAPGVPRLHDSMQEAKDLNRFLQALSFKTYAIEARIRKASSEQAIRVSRRRYTEKAEADEQRRRQLMARGGGDFWEAAGKYPAGPKGETFAKAYQKARQAKVPVGALQSARTEESSAEPASVSPQLAPVENFQVPPGRTVVKAGANECLQCEGVNKDGSQCVRLVTLKDIAKYGGRIMCWQHR